MTSASGAVTRRNDRRSRQLLPGSGYPPVPGSGREAERAVELEPIEKSAYFGPYLQLHLARVHMMVGSKDKAIELLKPLVEVPNNLSTAGRTRSPAWPWRSSGARTATATLP